MSRGIDGLLVATLPLRPTRVSTLPSWRLLRYDLNHLAGIVFPMTAGAAIYGWRAPAAVGTLCVSTGLAMRVWSRVGSSPMACSPGNLMIQAILLAFMLPAALFDILAPRSDDGSGWPLLVAGGVLLAFFNRVIGALGSRRVHPLLLTILTLWLCFPKLISPNAVLHRSRAFVGDVLKSSPANREDVRRPEGWIFEAPPAPVERDGRKLTPAAQTIEELTRLRRGPRPTWVTAESVVRDDLPPLEDLIVGGQPAGLGLGSAIAVVVGGLFLIYRGVLNFRLPMAAAVIGYATLLIAPLPVVITETGADFRWLAGRDPRVGWALAVTFVNYAFLASPLLFTAFFLSSLPGVSPVAPRATMMFALIVALLAVPLQLYVSMQVGPYLALIAATLLTPTLDYHLCQKPLV